MKIKQATTAVLGTLVLSCQVAWADITIGVSVSATGPGASLGIPEKNIFALLPGEIAGEKLKFVVLDDATDPSVAARNARKLVTEDEVDVLIGSTVTPASLAISEVAAESRTPQVSMSPINVSGAKYAWVFCTPQQNEVMASALVAHMKAQGVKTLGFIGYADAYGEDWIKALGPLVDAAGIEVVASERYGRSDSSVRGQVLKLVAARPDAVIVVGSGSPAALPQTTLKERGYAGQIYQTHAAANKAFLGVAGKAAEGVILPVGPVVVVEQIADGHPSKKIGADLIRQYDARYGAGAFSSFAGYAYDAWRLVEAAVPAALKAGKPGTPEFRKGLRDALESTRNVVASNGVFNMSATDHFGLDARSRVLVQVEGGAFKVVR